MLRFTADHSFPGMHVSRVLLALWGGILDARHCIGAWCLALPFVVELPGLAPPKRLILKGTLLCFQNCWSLLQVSPPALGYPFCHFSKCCSKHDGNRSDKCVQGYLLGPKPGPAPWSESFGCVTRVLRWENMFSCCCTAVDRFDSVTRSQESKNATYASAVAEKVQALK